MSSVILLGLVRAVFPTLRMLDSYRRKGPVDLARLEA